MTRPTVRFPGPAQPAAHGRVDWVDHAKGFCIILVVMMHSTLGVEKAMGETGWLGTFVEFARPFRMPDFFLISGLFLGLVIDRPWRRYIDRKVVHFLYFYVLWLTIQFAFKAPMWMADGLTPSMEAAGMPAVQALPLSVLLGEYAYSFVQPFGTLWFIYMLPVFFLVTRLLVRIPWWALLAAAAFLEILPIHTGWLMIDEFAARYVYFLAGYLFATRIFGLAEWVRTNLSMSLGLLVAWALINALIVFAPVSEALHEMTGVSTHADLPVVSLMLGSLGALAIIFAAALLSKVPGTAFLEYLGRNSIVVYLAFFLPMVVTRILLFRFAGFLDTGTISLLVTLAGVAGPVIFFWIIQRAGMGHFLFHRPAWAWIDRPGGNEASRARLHPAE